MPSNAFVRPNKFSCVISSAILIFLESMGGLNFTSYWQRCQSGVISNLKQLVTTGKARPEVPYSKTKKTSISNDLQSNGNLFLQYFFTKWKKLECRGFFLPLKKNEYYTIHLLLFSKNCSTQHGYYIDTQQSFSQKFSKDLNQHISSIFDLFPPRFDDII